MTTSEDRSHHGLRTRRSLARVVDELVIALIMAPWIMLAAIGLGLSSIAGEESDLDTVILAATIIAVGVGLGGLYEVCASRNSRGIGKLLVGLRVTKADHTRLSAREGLARWILLVGPTPLLWLSLAIDGTSSEEYRGLVRGVLAVSLVWRAVIAVSVFATAGRGGVHDRLTGSHVFRARGGSAPRAYRSGGP
jgi:uncharacterized RDD family membrane protein YckC